MKKMVCLLTAFVSLLWAGAQGPQSHEAVQKEVYNASEVVIKATGIGKNPSAADEDMKKAAVWYVLEGSTDPLLNTPEAKQKFQRVAEELWDMKTVSRFITWEAQKVNKQLRIKDGVKRTKHVRVNKALLKDWLVQKNIVIASADLQDKLGMPTIMVLPETKPGQTPLQVFASNNLAKHAAGVIESYLTAKQYEVVVPRAQEQLNQVSDMQAQLAEQDQDPAYQLALTLGSDIYVIFSGKVENSKASVVVKAYETTTARLLGTETGYSKARPGVNMEPLVEEAIADAFARVIARVNAYWMKDLKKGIQYKLIVKMDPSIPKGSALDIQDDIIGALEDNFKTKENILTDKTIDFLLWAKADEFSSSSKIARFLRRQVESAKLERLSVNKKLIILKASAN